MAVELSAHRPSDAQLTQVAMSAAASLGKEQHPLRKLLINLFCGFIVFVMPSSLRNWRASVRDT
jgi:hypothetical protein